MIVPEKDTHLNNQSEDGSQINGHVQSAEKQTKEAGVIDIFRHSECRKDSLVMFFAWIATNLGLK